MSSAELLLVHVHLERVLELVRVDAHGARHVVRHLVHGLLQSGGHLVLQLGRHGGHVGGHGRLDVALQGGGDLGLEVVRVDHGLDRSIDLGLDVRLLHEIGGRQRVIIGVVDDVPRRVSIGVQFGNLRRRRGRVVLKVRHVLLHDAAHEVGDLVFRNVDVERAGDLVHVRFGRFGHVLQAALQVQGAGHVHGQLALVDGERRLDGVAVDGEQRVHVERAFVVFLFAEGLAREHVDVGLGQLVLHDLAGGRLVDDVPREGRGVVQACAQHGGARVLARLHDADDVQVLAVLHQGAHEVLVVRLVLPHAELLVVLVEVCGVDQLESDAQDVVVGIGVDVVGGFHVLFGRELLHHAVEARRRRAGPACTA